MAKDLLWPEADMTRRDVRFKQFMEVEEMPEGINLEAYRENRNGRTFSSEVIEDLLDTQVAFMAAKMKRHWEETGKAPHRIRISVDVELES